MTWTSDINFQHKRADIRRRGIEALTEAALTVPTRSESPIEDLFAAAIVLVPAPLYFSECSSLIVQTFALCWTYDGGELNWEGDPYPETREYALVWQQVPISGFRVDFLIIGKFGGRAPVRLIVECDGHDFHERTKEQAERDRSRDRALTSLGFTVLRFTGREIWRDAISCAHEIGRLLERLEFEGRQT